MKLPESVSVCGATLRRELPESMSGHVLYRGRLGGLRLTIDCLASRSGMEIEQGWRASCDLGPGSTAHLDPGWSWWSVRTPERAAEILAGAIEAFRAALPQEAPRG